MGALDKGGTAPHCATRVGIGARMPPRLAHKVVFVAGAGSGIGLVTAQRFVAKGPACSSRRDIRHEGSKLPGQGAFARDRKDGAKHQQLVGPSWPVGASVRASADAQALVVEGRTVVRIWASEI